MVNHNLHIGGRGMVVGGGGGGARVAVGAVLVGPASLAAPDGAQV